MFVPLDADASTPFAVTVTSATPGAEIRYTLNGADPVLTDLPVASGASVAINCTVTLKAKAWAGAASSTVTSSTYSVSGNIAAGGTHALSLAWAKEVKAWGSQANGRLGNGLNATANVTSPVASKYSSTVSITDAIGIAAGLDHSLFLSGDASLGVWGFGTNTSGQLGDNTATNRQYAVQVLKSATAGDYLVGIAEVAAGSNFSAASGTDGSVSTWGSKTSGRLGDGTTSGTRKFAGKVQRGDVGGNPDLSGITSARAGGGFALARESCVLRADFMSYGISKLIS